jgi:hypothetical protein
LRRGGEIVTLPLAARRQGGRRGASKDEDQHAPPASGRIVAIETAAVTRPVRIDPAAGA